MSVLCFLSWIRSCSSLTKILAQWLHLNRWVSFNRMIAKYTTKKWMFFRFATFTISSILGINAISRSLSWNILVSIKSLLLSLLRYSSALIFSNKSSRDFSSHIVAYIFFTFWDRKEKFCIVNWSRGPSKSWTGTLSWGWRIYQCKYILVSRLGPFHWRKLENQLQKDIWFLWKIQTFCFSLLHYPNLGFLNRSI